MKSIINKEEEKKEEIKYPCLMSLIDDSNMIVYFLKEGSGICIASNVAAEISLKEQDWSMRAFTPFKGTITLSN